MKIIVVRFNSKWYLVDENYNFVLNEGFYDLEQRGNLFIVKRKENECNVVDSNGKFIFSDWYEHILTSRNYIYVFKNFNERNILKEDGTLMFDCWFDSIEEIENEGIFRVTTKEGKYGLFSSNGTNLFGEYFKFCGGFFHGFAVVENEECRFNYVNLKNNKYLSSTWFYCCYGFYSGSYGKVENEKGKYNLIDINGKLIFNEWFDYIDNYFENGYIVIRKNHKYNKINFKGELFYRIWVDRICNFTFNGKCFSEIKLNNKINFANENGQILCNLWFDDYTFSSDNKIIVKLGKKWNVMNNEFEFLFEEWKDSPNE